MIKKILFVFIVCALTLSCGKKGDPEYEKKDGNIKKFIKPIR
jgi:hypothetical protein